MATMDDLPERGTNALRHKKSLTEHTLEQMIANNPSAIPTSIKKNHSYQNGQPNPLKKKPHPKNGIIKKRKSEAALYINTSTLFPLQSSTKGRANTIHSKHNGHHTAKMKPKSGRFSHSKLLQSKANNKRMLKRRSYNPYDNQDKYEAFDFNAYRQKQQQKKEKQHTFVSSAPSTTQTRRRAITVNPPHSKPFKKVPNKPHMSTSHAKSVKFTAQTAATSRTKSPGISFRKSHNNLPIMHPDEAIQNKKKKKKTFNLYKQRASYSAAHFSKHKHQLLSQRSKKHHNNNNNAGAHYKPHTHSNAAMREDDAFVNSLLQPIKKKELQEAIQKLKEVIESTNITNLCGSTVEMTLREVLRKLQLLRLEVTLREYKLHAASEDTTTTDDEYPVMSSSNSNGGGGTSSIGSQPMSMMASQSFEMPSKLSNLHLDEIKEEKAMKEIPAAIETNEDDTERKKERESREEEQDRILNEICGRDEEDKTATVELKSDDKDLVSALLFASKYHRNHYEIDGKHAIKSGGIGDASATQNAKIKLTRRRFTLTGAKPTDSDRAGIEVAQWLSTRYSTFGRYEIPPSPLSVPIHPLSPKDKDKRISQLTLNNSEKSPEEIQRKEHEKRKKLFEEKKRKIDTTRRDINRFLKLITSDQILMKLHGIGDDWNWSIFELHDICGDSTLLITAHYIFEQLNLFEKFTINYTKFQSFFSVIQRGYQENPYHSSLHGADVLINIYFWIKSDHEFRSYLSDLDMIIALISAACHDYMHPGLTQNFQIATNSDMALKYNGRSVLENMHCSETIRLLLRPEYAIFASLKKSEFRYVRELITDMILGTDMQRHSDHVCKSNELCALYEDESIKKEEIDREKHTKHVLVVGLHVADIANPCKPWLDCKRWTYMLMEEWFRQGDKEKTMGLEVSPMMDRSKPNIPRGQVGFIDYIVKPIFVNWSKLFDQTSVCLQHLMINRENWNKCNADPHANNVKYQLSKLATNPKLLQLNQPISMDHPNNTPIPGADPRDEGGEDSGDDNNNNKSQFHTVIVAKKTKKKRNNRKKKKKNVKSKKNHKKRTLKVSNKNALSIATPNGDNNVMNVNAKTTGHAALQDVPFTPEQAEALHVTSYNDLPSSSGDNDAPPIQTTTAPSMD